MSLSRFPLILTVLISLGLPHCATTGDQGEVNEIIQDISNELVGLFNQFAAASNCEQVQQVITNLSGTVLCEMGGNSTTTITSVLCTEDPLTVTFDGRVSTDNCDVGDNVSNGSYTVQVSITQDLDMATVNGSNFVINGLNFSFMNFMVSQSGGGSANCSGTLTVDASQCTVSSNCSNCPL